MEEGLRRRRKILLFAFLFLGFLISITYAGNGTCWGNTSDSGVTSLLSSCCWYSDDSCCTDGAIFWNNPYDGSSFDNIFLDAYNEFSDGGKTTNATYQECFTYYEQIRCSVCAPDNSYASWELSENNTIITIVSVCKSFCNNFWNACKELPLAEGFKGSANDFCFLFSNDKLGIFVPPSSKNCFSGLSSDIVGNSECNPWGDNYEGGSNWFYLFFFCIAIGGFVLVVVVAAVCIVGLILYKKKQAAISTNSIDNDSPSSDEINLDSLQTK